MAEKTWSEKKAEEAVVAAMRRDGQAPMYPPPIAWVHPPERPEFAHGREVGERRNRTCWTCGRYNCAPVNHAGWTPDDERRG